MSLLVAAPGGGKSILALLYAIETNVPSLFFSADTDLVTMATRAGSAVLGWPQETVEKALDSPEVTGALKSIDHIKWCDQSQPTIQDIYLEVKAYLEVMGECPKLIVVDNLVDVQADGSVEGWSATRWNVDQLKKLARESQAHVLTLAHATGKYEDGTEPIPLSGLEYKPGKNVEMVLTMYWSEGELRICPVKNRGGESSASATKHISLYADLSRCSIHDPAHGRWTLGRTA